MKNLVKNSIVLFSLIVLVLIFNSCNGEIITQIPQTDVPTSFPETTNQVVNVRDLMPDNCEISAMDVMLITLEEAIYSSHNIVEGKYIETNYYRKHCEHKFLVEKQYKGVIQEEYVTVSSWYNRSTVIFQNSAVCTYNTYDTVYKNGESYILMLESSTITVYHDSPRYLSLADVVIPVNDISNSVMYGKENVRKHSKLTENDLSSYDSFIKYLNAEIDRVDISVPIIKYSFITSDKLDEIVEAAEYIFEIEVIEIDEDYYPTVSERFICKIVDQYKGNTELEEIGVWFKKGEMKSGERIIVAVNNVSDHFPEYFQLASIHGVYPVDKKQEILDLLG